jgi:hypothetical protein
MREFGKKLEPGKPRNPESSGYRVYADLVITVEAKEEGMLNIIAQDIADSAIELGAVRVDRKTTLTIAEKMEESG